MSKEYIDLGSAPALEQCASVGRDDYHEKIRIETKAYVNQLWRVVEKQFAFTRATAPNGFDLKVKGFPHDFGTYYEVVACYDSNNEESAKLAYSIEEKSPENWDKEAKFELADKGYIIEK